MPSPVGGASGPAVPVKATEGYLWTFTGGRWQPSAPAAAVSGIDYANPVSITGTTTVTSSGVNKVHLCTGTSADYTVNLPDSGMTAGDLIAFQMGTTTTLTKLVTLDATSGNLIDGVQTRVMWSNEVAVLKWDGTNWCKIAGKSIPMICAIQETANKTVATVTETVVDFDTFGYGNQQGMHDSGNKRIKCMRAGFYQVSGGVQMEALTGATFVIGALAINAAAATGSPAMALYLAPGGQYAGPSFSVPCSLAVNDYCNMTVYHNKGSNANTRSGVSVGCRSWLLATEINIW